MEKAKIKNTSKYPTTLIVKGLNPLGIEIAKTLVEQEGYVIILDELPYNYDELVEEIENKNLLTLLDIDAIDKLESDIRRLDYVYYFSHESENYLQEISSQVFLQQSNYIDTVLDLSLKHKAKFMLTTSMRAHELLIEYDDKKLLQNKHIPKYSSTEFQLYAENLTSEYADKLDLDTRVIRIGEILGKGINPDLESALSKLIVNAVDNKDLEIYGDGLETAFYIHYLDAARGLIKAMFSLNTQSKTYSLAIPEEISILSIAYKINESFSSNTQIRFVDGESNLPPLRLHRPATNLTAIGWEPRISIERSIAQTIEFVEHLKEAIPEKEIKGDSDNEVIENTVAEKPQAEGALARLISDRKRQDQDRIGKVIMANQKRKEKNKDKGIGKISRDTFWMFENVKRRFIFLKNLTVRDFMVYVLLGILFGLFYFFIISPSLNIINNLSQSYFISQSIQSDLENDEFDTSSENFSKINNNLESVQDRLEDLRFLFTVFAQQERYNEYQSSIEIQQNYLEGIEDTIIGIEPLYKHLTNNRSVVIARNTGDSLLEVQASTSDLDLNDFDNASTNLQSGIEKINLYSDEFEESLSIYPPFLSERFTPIVNNINTSLESFRNLESNLDYLPELIGMNSKTGYLFLVQDNTQYTPLGGEVVGYIYIGLENGVVSDTKANTLKSLDIETIQLSDSEIEDINLLSTNQFEETVDIGSVNYMPNTKIASDIYQQSISNQIGRKIDAITFINLSSLESLLTETSNIEVEGIQISSENFLEDIDRLTGEDEEDRDISIARISSHIFAEILNSDDLLKFTDTTKSQIEKNNIAIESSRNSIELFFEQYAPEIIATEDFLSFGTISDLTTPIDKYANISLDGKITINGETINKDITVRTNEPDNQDIVWICSPAGSKDFSYPDIENVDYSTNFSNEEVCQVYNNSELEEYNLVFDIDALDNNIESGYSYIMQLDKPSGINVDYNLEFIFETDGTTVPEVDPTILNTNSFNYSGKLEQNLIFRFTQQ